MAHAKRPPHSPFHVTHAIVAGVVVGTTGYDLYCGAPALSHARELQLIGIGACLELLLFQLFEVGRRWRDARRQATGCDAASALWEEPGSVRAGPSVGAIDKPVEEMCHTDRTLIGA